MEVAIFTRGKNEKLLNLIKDFKNQTLKPIIKVYSDEDIDGLDVCVILTPGLSIAQKRNLAIQQAKGKFLFLLDDDNELNNKTFLATLLNFYQKIPYKLKIISPYINWRHTTKIQSAGVYFSYVLGKVFVNKKIKGDYWEVKGIGGNSLFAETKNFKKVKFDKKMGFIREDLDYIYSFRGIGGKVFVLNLPIYHMERDKNLAERSFVFGSIFDKKIKNRDIFVKKHGNIFQKLIFWCFGRWISLIGWHFKRLISK